MYGVADRLSRIGQTVVPTMLKSPIGRDVQPQQPNSGHPAERTRAGGAACFLQVGDALPPFLITVDRGGGGRGQSVQRGVGASRGLGPRGRGDGADVRLTPDGVRSEVEAQGVQQVGRGGYDRGAVGEGGRAAQAGARRPPPAARTISTS